MNDKAKKLAAAALALGLMIGVAQLPASAAAPTAQLEQTNSFLSGLFGKDVPVTGIELGDYQATMTVGTTQLLSPVILPENATDKTLTIFSENSNIVAVNEQGYIGAAAVGTTRVGVTCGDVTVYYTITVEPDPSTVVTDMDVSLSASEIAVGDTASISIAVMPTTAASSAEVVFTSSNEAVATVNSFGRVTAVAPGKATITVQCGDVVRTVDVTVAVQTDRITLNSSYVVLKPGATHTIQASVSPASAPQALTYTSLDSKVATVTSSGVIRAAGTGSTTVVVSNGATKAAITVIVNQGTASSGSTGEAPTPTEPEQTDVDTLVEQIQSAADGAVLEARLSVVPAAVLNALSGTDKSLTVPQDGYSLTIHGRAIKNASNELDTRLAFAETEDGLEFTLNGGGYMPGEVEVTLDEATAAAYRYLYLYNSTTEEWQQLNTYENGVLTLDTAGRYLLRSEVFRTWGLGWWFVITVSVLVVVLAVFYIGFKRRYWFW